MIYKTDQNIKNKQKISSPKNNTDQNIQKEAQKEADDTQQINMPVHSNNNSQVEYDIDMVIERQPVLPQDIQCPNAISHIQEHEIASVHQNPAVIEAIQRFQQGELLHTVDTCKTCLETRPVFHATPPIHKGAKNQTSPISIKPWKIFPDGTCRRCHTEQNGRLKKVVKKAAKFSGEYSQEVDLGPTTDTIRHNNMHFLPVPPYLQNLTCLEMSLISRISVIMNIHVLKYGMMSAKGHCILHLFIKVLRIKLTQFLLSHGKYSLMVHVEDVILNKMAG